jgi:hypothetical protein
MGSGAGVCGEMALPPRELSFDWASLFLFFFFLLSRFRFAFS